LDAVLQGGVEFAGRREWDGSRGTSLPASARRAGTARRAELRGEPPGDQEEGERYTGDADHSLIVMERRRQRRWEVT
jgi:hypothetical protein